MRKFVPARMLSLDSIVSDPLELGSDIIEKASKFHLEAFSCWKEALHHFSTKLEIVTYERDCLLVQLQEANAEKLKLQRQFREKLRSQVKRTNSLKDMLNLLGSDSNDLDSPVSVPCVEVGDNAVPTSSLEAGSEQTTLVEQGNYSSSQEIVCVEEHVEKHDSAEEAVTFGNLESQSMPAFSEKCSSSSSSGTSSAPPPLQVPHNCIDFQRSMVDVHRSNQSLPDRFKYHVDETSPDLGATDGDLPGSNAGEDHEDDECSAPNARRKRKPVFPMYGRTKTLLERPIKTEESCTEVEKGFNIVNQDHNIVAVVEDAVEPGMPINVSFKRTDCLCSICDRSFTNIRQLKKHRLLHSQERPFQCTECGKSFRLKHHLVEHTRVHTGYKPYRCTACGRGFNRRGIAELHVCKDSSAIQSENIQEGESQGM